MGIPVLQYSVYVHRNKISGNGFVWKYERSEDLSESQC